MRVVGLEDESQNGVMSLDRAIRMAEQRQMDVVEVAGNQNPPIVRIVEYSKFKYEQKKRQKENKARQHVVQMKEIRFGPNTDQHDFNFKLKHAIKFLEEGNKVRAYVHFRGRSIIYKERGEKILLEFAQELQDLAKVEMLPKMEGKRMYLILAPRTTKSKKDREKEKVKKQKVDDARAKAKEGEGATSAGSEEEE